MARTAAWQQPIVPTEQSTRIHADVFFGDLTDNC
jgi:hypothetical protein